MIKLRKGTQNDLVEMQTLFLDTIHIVCKNDYSEKQREVWSSSVENKTRWHSIFENQIVLIAEINTKIVGFITLENHNYIDFLYVHHNFQRKGIASELLVKIEKIALKNNQNQLFADVSITAKSFFISHGFDVVNSQKVIRKNVELTNFKISKNLF